LQQLHDRIDSEADAALKAYSDDPCGYTEGRLDGLQWTIHRVLDFLEYLNKKA